VTAAGERSPARSRLGLVLALVATVGAGLLSRRHPLPGILAEHTGDALYATAVCLGLAVVAPRQRSAVLAGGAFVLSSCVEFAQCLQWPWLVELRATPVGALVLGQGFQWPDLVAYAAGSLLGWVIVAVFSRRAAQ